MPPSVFSRIISGEEPARFVWSDETVVGFLTIAPLSPGHTLVVPRRELDQWTDAPDALLGHCMSVAQRIGRALKHAFDAPRAGVVIAGYEVPHLHVHVFASWSMHEFDWSSTRPATAKELDSAAETLRSSLQLPSVSR